MQQPSWLQGNEPVNKLLQLPSDYIHYKIACHFIPRQPAAILKTSTAEPSGRSHGCMREVHVGLLRGVLLFRGSFPPYLNANYYTTERTRF